MIACSLITCVEWSECKIVAMARPCPSSSESLDLVCKLCLVPLCLGICPYSNQP